MKRLTLAVIPLALATAGCQSVGDIPNSRLGQATLKHSNGLPAGTAQLFSKGDKVEIAIALTGIPAGVHAVHLHTTGKCDGPEFTTAGGHLNPHSRQHGTENPAGPHVGDLPNMTIGSSGAGTATATLTGTQAEALAQIFDADGTAIVVHAGPDDYKTDPAGNAGGRIACGVVTRT
ncbi:superoxide dismutase family protein [Altererythrobacter xixiisoli]|uniref:Superoxide dismutase [Cu-Zn] n=1 Tax=Croceibacterium xixiisoli TaxID=1476466 RepID=A0A6I4TZT0_9SPHN|nr:superoxide dismutase family protein [Croceibacterium xixiisoli]MXP00149.1 superoxide dismutase family protein [Croceibacterium xixiisoli]